MKKLIKWLLTTSVGKSLVENVLQDFLNDIITTHIEKSKSSFVRAYRFQIITFIGSIDIKLWLREKFK